MKRIKADQAKALGKTKMLMPYLPFFVGYRVNRARLCLFCFLEENLNLELGS